MKEKEETKPKNQQKIHKKESSYGGYGGNSSANMNGSIDEFDDNLTVDLNNDEKNEHDTVSETNRLARTTPTDESSNEQHNGLNKERAEGFDRIKKDNNASPKPDKSKKGGKD